MSHIWVIVLMLACLYAHAAAAQTLPQAFLSRFRRTVNNVAHLGEPAQAAVTGVVNTVVPAAEALPAAPIEHYKSAVYPEQALLLSETPVLDTLAAQHQAALQSGYPVATLVSNAAAASSNRLGHFIAEAPVATALSYTSPKAIQQAAQQAALYPSQSGNYEYYNADHNSHSVNPEAKQDAAIPLNDDALTAALIQTAIDSLSRPQA